MAVHGHTVRRLPGYSDTVFRTVFPTKERRSRAETVDRQCGKGGEGGRLAAGLGAVAAKLEK